jgi:hypothetical protein
MAIHSKRSQGVAGETGRKQRNFEPDAHRPRVLAQYWSAGLSLVWKETNTLYVL